MPISSWPIALSVRRVDLIIQRDRLLAEKKLEAFSALVGRRAQREPVPT
jgi:hypothetical protein